MKREFWATYSLYFASHKKEIIDYFVDRVDEPPSREFEQIQDPFARQQLLTQLAATDEEIQFRDAKGRQRNVAVKDYVRTGSLQHKEFSGLLFWYYGSNKGLDLCRPGGPFQAFLADRLRWMQAILEPADATAMTPRVSDVSLFPPGSWAVELSFTLRKAYLSKDDREFYVLDNPVRKEWVFQVPYVAPSQWKGALRAAMVQVLKRWWEGIPEAEKASKAKEFAERRFRLTLLFGDEKGEEPGSLKGLARYLDELGGGEAARLYREKVREHFGAGDKSSLPHHRGHLHFYPTYFDRIGLEVINPHDRTTGAGKQPIYFECVPSGAQGVFRLLYVPLNGVDEQEMRKGFREVAEGLRAMFTEYGFGAKTSSGFGRAHVRWKKEEGAKVQPENELWNEWERIWQEEEPNE